jgi:hypothetical protein
VNLALWLLQGLLAVAFLAHGWLFLSPPADMVEQFNASLLAAVTFVGYMRWKVKPISPRGTE